MRAIYYIKIAGVNIPVLENSESELIVLNPLVLLIPGHVPVEKEGEDNLSINDVWDIQKALSKQTLSKSDVLREDTSANDFDEPHIK